MPVMDRFRNSRLVFAGVHEPSPKAVSIEDLSRVREPVSRSKSGVQGKVADVLHGRSRHAESQNEIKAFRVLAATARADEWQEQPFFMEFHRDGKRHRYTPDVLVVWGSHREVVEIKEDGEAELAENKEGFALIVGSSTNTVISSGCGRPPKSALSRGLPTPAWFCVTGGSKSSQQNANESDVYFLLLPRHLWAPSRMHLMLQRSRAYFGSCWTGPYI